MSKENCVIEVKQDEVSMASLRRSLFLTLTDLRAGKVDAQQASAVAKVANAILKSAEVQMEFERMRLASEVPANLPEMLLSPRLKAAG